MSKRDVRKKERQRRFMRPKQVRIILAVWMEPGALVLSESLLHGLDCLKNQRFARTVYRPSGPDQQCYTNVQSQVEQHGGKAVLGWCVLPNRSSRVDAGRNKYAMFCLEAHCVWEIDDGLVEVTDGGHMPFILDPGVEPNTNGNIFFCDDDSCARKLLNAPAPAGFKVCHRIARI